MDSGSFCENQQVFSKYEKYLHITSFTLSSFPLSRDACFLQKLLKASPKPKPFTVLDTTHGWISIHISQVWGFFRL